MSRERMTTHISHTSLGRCNMLCDGYSWCDNRQENSVPAAPGVNCVEGTYALVPTAELAALEAVVAAAKKQSGVDRLSGRSGIQVVALHEALAALQEARDA